MDTAPNVDTLEFVETQFRILIGASTVGTIFGIILLYTLMKISFSLKKEQNLFPWINE
ncbi:DUF2837 family protein [Sediminibacillus dalangtanensis]|uniref:DUF2837 family protein n=1 Tax=Sediminibacillus dalangtanensis TaxID=2729421 RepID=A0ABX7VYA9_9BACI|nr:DUF2837 family protein [Sediminibacillus dalangtanensis]QTN01604.1 DUF2837 family protein [Sediminibacillus dalangtanensis]